MEEKNFNKKVKEKEELEKSEKESHERLKDTFCFDGKYKEYGFVDYSWYQKYKEYLNDLIDGKRNDIFHFDPKDAEIKTEKKIFCFKKNIYDLDFIVNFQLVTENLIKLILKNFKKANKINNFLFDAIIGGQCIIIMDYKRKCNYITFYEENKENQIDFWLNIENKIQWKTHLNLILNNNLLFYMGIINFKYNDEKKDIFDEKGKNIGFIIINCDSNRSIFLDSLKKRNLSNIQYQQLKNKQIINIELISKPISILASLSLFKEFINELPSYSQNYKYEKAKLLFDFYKKFPCMNHDREMKSISGLISINADIIDTFLEIIKFIDDEFLEINSIKEEKPKFNSSDENNEKID